MQPKRLKNANCAARLINSAKGGTRACVEVREGFVAHVPDDVNVKALRKRLGYSQLQFSRRFGFAIDAVQDWEQDAGPNGAHTAASLLSLPVGREGEGAQRVLDLQRVIQREPDAVTRDLAMQRRSRAQHNPAKLFKG